MSRDDNDSTRLRVNQARRVGDGKIYQAHQIRFIEGYREDELWVCCNTECAVRMNPVAWKEAKPDGSPYQIAPYFSTWRNKPHVSGCRPKDAETPDVERREHDGRPIGVPLPYPTQVIFEREEGQTPQAPLSDQGEPAAGHQRHQSGKSSDDEPHGTIARTIQRPCEVFVESADNHRLPLRVPDCYGGTYGAVFAPLMRFREVGADSRRIFYAELHMRALQNPAWSKLVDGRLRLPLLDCDRVTGLRRVLELDITGWKPGWGDDLVLRVNAAASEGWALWCAKRPMRPWVFFVATGGEDPGTSLSAQNYNGVAVLCCELPPHQWQAEPARRRHWQSDPDFDGCGDTDAAGGGEGSDRPEDPERDDAQEEVDTPDFRAHAERQADTRDYGSPRYANAERLDEWGREPTTASPASDDSPRRTKATRPTRAKQSAITAALRAFLEKFGWRSRPHSDGAP